MRFSATYSVMPTLTASCFLSKFEAWNLKAITASGELDSWRCGGVGWSHRHGSTEMGVAPDPIDCLANLNSEWLLLASGSNTNSIAIGTYNKLQS